MSDLFDAVTPVLAALFVDFDNIYINLQQQDPNVARQFAVDPGRWLAWLEDKLPIRNLPLGRGQRRILVRRCYLNPASFQDYRPYFIRAGFEVVDCPPLTSQGKTSTDIHMVMDILDSLAHPTRFSEFLILSGDADFTPVLIKLREHDRYTAVLSVGYISPAYKATCDYLITRDQFVQQALGIIYPEEEPNGRSEQPAGDHIPRNASHALLIRMAERLHQKAIFPRGLDASDLPTIYREFVEFKQSNFWLGYGTLRKLTEVLVALRTDLVFVEEDPWRIARAEFAPAAGQPSVAKNNGIGPTSDAERRELTDAIAAWIKEIVENASVPVSMAALAQAIQRQFGDYVADTEWLGFGFFKNLLAGLDLGALQIALVGPGYVYDPSRHQPPTVVTTQGSGDEARLISTQSAALDELSRSYPSLAPLAMKVHELTETPYLMPEHYALLLRELAREINENGSYQITRTSKKVRDRCVERGAPVARAHVNFVLFGIGHTGHFFGAHLPEVPEQLGECLVQNAINLCRLAQFNPNEQEIADIRTWIMGALL